MKLTNYGNDGNFIAIHMVKQLYLPWLQIAGFSCYFIREGLVQIALSSLSLSLSLSKIP